MILRSFSQRGWCSSRSFRSDGFRNSLPGLRKELPCALVALSKSILIERSSLELKAAAASVFSNLKMDFLGVEHSLEMIRRMVLTNGEGELLWGIVVGVVADLPCLRSWFGGGNSGAWVGFFEGSLQACGLFCSRDVMLS